MDINTQIKEKLGNRITEWLEHSPRRIYLTVDKESIKDTASILFNELGLRLSTATAQDLPEGFEILYHFSFDKTGQFFSVRVFIKGKKNPQIESIAPILKAAEWIEREMWELFGIDFKGHPDLRHLLLSDDWPKDEYPLRKDYKKPYEK
ncbi:MAG: NADH-quinone oxidoreductase subunit C [Candidatus Omnitrophota bacterium]